jgi:hypothetical protein
MTEESKRLARQLYAIQQKAEAEAAAAQAKEQEQQKTAQPDVVINFEDPLEKWRRDANERERQRANAKAELRREERDITRSTQPDWGALTALIDQRISAALAEQRRELVAVADSVVALSKAVDSKLGQIEKMLKSGASPETRPLDAPGPRTSADGKVKYTQPLVTVRP